MMKILKRILDWLLNLLSEVAYAATFLTGKLSKLFAKVATEWEIN